MTTELDEFDKEWDSQPHTTDEYRREIRELRGRCMQYIRERDESRAQTLESSHADFAHQVARAKEKETRALYQHALCVHSLALIEARVAELRANRPQRLEILGAWACANQPDLAVYLTAFYVLHGHLPSGKTL